MKIRVKHKETEVIVEDDGLRIDTNYNLINYNQDYIIRLIKEITENIIKIQQSNK
jgi:transcriptional regulator of NAD metabolism